MNKKFQIRGFTLIELLVVISILGILASLLISNVTGARERARDSQRKSDLLQIKEALRMYKNDFGGYPTTGGSNTIKGCGTTALPADCPWGNEFKKDNTTYMKLLPKDPSSSDTSNVYYKYSQIDQDSFLLYALLENKSDQDIAKSQTRCGGSVTNAYYVCTD
jgi:general secretion pathway protein G